MFCIESVKIYRMKLIVYGACGRTGREVCSQALARGHEVVGIVREACEIESVKTYLNSRKQDIVTEMLGADAVISVIGHTSLNEKGTQTNTTEAIVKLMGAGNISRIVTLTGTGARIKGDKVSLFDRILNLPLQLFNRNRIDDGINHLSVLQQSELNWTTVRVLKLTNNSELEHYSLTEGGPAKKFIGRKTVAKILIDLAESGDWNCRTPIVSD